MREQTNHLIFKVILAFLILNLFLPGENNSLSFTITQVVLFGLTALYILFLRPQSQAPGWWPLAVLFGLAIFVSQLVSVHPFGSLQTAVQLTSMVLLAWLVSDLGPSDREVRFAVVTLFAVAVALSFYGISQLFTFFLQQPDPELVMRILPVSERYVEQIYTQKRIFAGFALPTSFSAFLAIIIPLGVLLAFQNYRKKAWFAVTIGGLLVMAFALVQAKSHGGPVAVVGATIIALALVFRKRVKLLLFGFISALVVAALLLLAIGALRGDFIWDLAAENSPIRLRWDLWMAGLAMWGRHWLFGVGLDNFQIGFLPFISPGVRETQYLHNTYLQLPAELGLLGLVLVISCLGMLLRRIWLETGDWLNNRDLLRLGIVVAVICFLLLNGIEIVLYFNSLGMLGAFLIGLMLRRSTPIQESSDVPVIYRVVTVSIAVLCVAAVALLGRWFIADYFFNRAGAQVTIAALEPQEEFLLGRGPAETDSSKAEDVEGRVTKWEGIRDLATVAAVVEDGNFEYHYLLGVCAERLYQLRGEEQFLFEAQRNYQNAIDRCPEMPYLRFANGLALLRQGRLLAANQEVATASSLYPTRESYSESRQVLEARIDILRNNRQQKIPLQDLFRDLGVSLLDIYRRFFPGRAD